MPLVIVCGVPCSGKTKRTNEIRDILTRNGQEVRIVNDELCSIKYADYGLVEIWKTSTQRLCLIFSNKFHPKTVISAQRKKLVVKLGPS